MLEPEDSGFVKIKTIDPLLYKDLYNLVGLIIEAATGHSYYEEVTRRFLVPLSLTLTTPSDRLELPGFEYSKADMDGESNSYNGYKIKIGYKRMKKDYILSTFISADKKDYDKTHSIFNKTRDKKGYSATAIFTPLNPLGYDKIFTNFIVGYSYSDSNIDFFDKRTYISGVTIGYNF